MKYFVLTIALMCISFPVAAQTPVSKERADEYLTNCLKQPAAAGLSEKGKEIVCACTAARLPVFFTVEEWNAMIGQDPVTARPAYNKMMTDVYAPCMEEPTREKYYAMCAEDKNVNQEVCKCTADAIAGYMKTNGTMLFNDILAKDPTVMDPMAELEKNSNFQEFKQVAAKTCIR